MGTPMTLFGKQNDSTLVEKLMPYAVRALWALIGAAAIFVYQVQTSQFKSDFTMTTLDKRIADNTQAISTLRDEQVRLHSQLRPSVDLVSQDQFKEFASALMHRLDKLDEKTDRIIERQNRR